MRESGRGAIGFTTGLLIGGLVGAAIMLFNPRKSRTSLRDGVRKKMGAAQKAAQRSVRRVKKESAKLIHNAKRTAEDLGRTVVGPNGQVLVGQRTSKQKNR
jgi:gas vesicle protein